MTTPYYQDDHVTIYHGSNDGFIEDLDFDLVVTSPPYNIGGKAHGGSYFTNLKSGYRSYSDDMPRAEYVAWQRRLLARLWARLPDGGAIFYNHKPQVGGPVVQLPLELLPDEVMLRQIITWDRGSGFNRQFTYFVPASEWIMLLAKPAFRTTTRSVDDVWRIPFEIGGEHPAPFPLKLATTAIGSTSAQVILDPFMGSGTTLRAAKDLNRKAIGIELDERYCEIAAKRCAQEVLAL